MLRLRVKEVAEERDLKQKELAKMAKVSPQLIHRYWNNYVGSVNFADLDRIARALGVPDKELLINGEERA
jgi:transcriptional regulator with XRE-family HTH domain